MSISVKKITYIILVLSLGLISSCSNDDDETLTPVQIPGNTDPVKPGPSDPPAPDPIEGKRRVIIGNYFDVTVVKPKRDSKGYSQDGVWEQSSLKGFRDSISRYSREADASVTYETSKLGSARYCVSVFKVKHSNSESDTSVKLFDDEVELASKSFNYTIGGGWTHIGEYNFAGEKVSRVVISRGDNSNGGVLRADDVKFIKLKEGYDCYGRTYANVKKNAILDNRFDIDAVKPKRDSAGYRESGVFQKSSLKGFRDSISRYSTDDQAYVTYTAMVQNPKYCLKVFRVSHPNSATEVKISVSQGLSVIEEVIIDYSVASSEKGWVEIGNMNFDIAKPVVVKVEKVSSGAGVLRADAVKFQKKACK